MESVHQQQARDELVSGKRIESNRVETARVGQYLKQPLQTCTVEVGDQRDQVLAPLLGYWPGRAKRTQQAVDPLAGLTE
jgi:hypothetical protein